MKIPHLDRIHLVVSGLTIVCWATLIYSLLVFDQARPEMQTIITQYHHIEVRKFWLINIYERLVWLLWFCAAISVINLGINIYLRTKSQDVGWLSPILLCVVSIAASVVLWVWQPLMEH